MTTTDTIALPRAKRRRLPRPPKFTRRQKITLALDTVFMVFFFSALVTGDHPVTSLFGLTSAATSIHAVLLDARRHHLEAMMVDRVSWLLVFPMLAALLAGI